MKFKDYFSKLKEQGKIENEEFNKFLESIPEGELPDSVFTLLEDNFLTRERAKSDPKIGGLIKYELFSAVDKNIHEILPDLNLFNAADIQNQKDTFKKIGMLKEAITETIQKVKKDSPDTDTKIKEYKKMIEESTEREKANKATFEKALQDERSKWEGELKGTKLTYALKENISKYKFADEYENDKETVTELILAKVGKHTLDFGEKGQILVFENENGVQKPKYNGNDPVTIDKLLDEATKPYLKKNNGDAGEGQEQRKSKEVPLPNGNKNLRQGARTVVTDI